jgi:transcriptional regulator with XRE-family HTH domain
MEDINRGIGRRVKRIREASDKTQDELGVMLGVKKATVSKYESGETKLTPEALKKIAELGGITLDELITGKPPTVEILMNSLEPEEMDKLRGTYSLGPMGATIIRDTGGLEKAHSLQYVEPHQASGVDQFILSEIKAADSETVGAVMELLIKRRSKPEGSRKNGTDG